MDLSSLLTNTLLGNSSVKALSEICGVEMNKVQQVLTNALPNLLQGMQKNAATSYGEQSLSSALSNHAQKDASDIVSFLKNADIADGSKILSHVLGNNKFSLISEFARKFSLTTDQVVNILGKAAPFLLNLLGKQQKTENAGLQDLLASALSEGKSASLADKISGGFASLFGGSSEKKASAQTPVSQPVKQESKPAVQPSVPKKPAAKKTAPKKAVAKKPATKKATAKKAVAKKPAAKKATAKKAVAKKPAAKKATAKKAVAKKATAKKVIDKKSVAKKTTAKKTAGKKPVAKKAAAKKTASKKPVAKKTTAKKAVAKKSGAKKATAKKAPPKKSGTKKTTAKKTVSRKK